MRRPDDVTVRGAGSPGLDAGRASCFEERGSGTGAARAPGSGGHGAGVDAGGKQAGLGVAPHALQLVVEGVPQDEVVVDLEGLGVVALRVVEVGERPPGRAARAPARAPARASGSGARRRRRGLLQRRRRGRRRRRTRQATAAAAPCGRRRRSHAGGGGGAAGASGASEARARARRRGGDRRVPRRHERERVVQSWPCPSPPRARRRATSSRTRRPAAAAARTASASARSSGGPCRSPGTCGGGGRASRGGGTRGGVDRLRRHLRLELRDHLVDLAIAGDRAVELVLLEGLELVAAREVDVRERLRGDEVCRVRDEDLRERRDRVGRLARLRRTRARGRPAPRCSPGCASRPFCSAERASLKRPTLRYSSARETKRRDPGSRSSRRSRSRMRASAVGVSHDDEKSPPPGGGGDRST